MSQAFIERLWGLERAELAELRRSLAFNPGTHPPTYRTIENFAMHAKSRLENDAYYLVAGLFALNERPNPDRPAPTFEKPRNLGQSIAELYVARQKTRSVEDRFIALLDADAEQLPYRLRQMVALLRDAAVIDWQTLLNDLRFWNLEDKKVQRRWAQSFYRHVSSAVTEGQSQTPTEEAPQ
jgi:CRISPR system Cascade subunit CasB